MAIDERADRMPEDDDEDGEGWLYLPPPERQELQEKQSAAYSAALARLLSDDGAN